MLYFYINIHIYFHIKFLSGLINYAHNFIL